MRVIFIVREKVPRQQARILSYQNRIIARISETDRYS
jgi:hypothetical protein